MTACGSDCDLLWSACGGAPPRSSPAPNGRPPITHEVYPQAFRRHSRPYATGLSNVDVVAVATSTGPWTGSPGFHVVRRDPKDAPNIYNTDSYDVVEDITAAGDFLQVCKTAGLPPDSVHPTELSGFVFVLGPKRRPDHHSPWCRKTSELPSASRVRGSEHSVEQGDEPGEVRAGNRNRGPRRLSPVFCGPRGRVRVQEGRG